MDRPRTGRGTGPRSRRSLGTGLQQRNLHYQDMLPSDRNGEDCALLNPCQTEMPLASFFQMERALALIRAGAFGVRAASIGGPCITCGSPRRNLSISLSGKALLKGFVSQRQAKKKDRRNLPILLKSQHFREPDSTAVSAMLMALPALMLVIQRHSPNAQSRDKSGGNDKD